MCLGHDPQRIAAARHIDLRADDAVIGEEGRLELFVEVASPGLELALTETLEKSSLILRPSAMLAPKRSLLSRRTCARGNAQPVGVVADGLLGGDADGVIVVDAVVGGFAGPRHGPPPGTSDGPSSSASAADTGSACCSVRAIAATSSRCSASVSLTCSAGAGGGPAWTGATTGAAAAPGSPAATAACTAATRVAGDSGRRKVLPARSMPLRRHVVEARPASPRTVPYRAAITDSESPLRTR